VLSEDFPAHLAGLQMGSEVAGYRLETQVGAGGMAVVFRARDLRLGRLVALKILAPGLATDLPFRRRFMAESRAAAAVDDPHIIPVYEAGEASGLLYIAMRFVGGGDLRLVLDQEGALPLARAAAFISPVASALDAAHDVGLVHRDVKPANILVDAHPDRLDHVYLSDFGVSKWAVSSISLTEPGQFLGTPDYSAPEQIQGRVVDGRTDQYALACVAYQLLTGTVPFERDQGIAVLLAHLSEPPPSLNSRRPGLPDAADQVLAKALAKAPEKRYESCRDFADALREALGLAHYNPRGSASTSGHPQPEIAAPRSEGSQSVGVAPGKVGAPADPAMAATTYPVTGEGTAGAVGAPPALVGDSAPQRPATADVSRSPFVRPSSALKKPFGRRILVMGVTICVLLAGGFLLLDQQSTPSVPPGHPEAILHDPGSAGLLSLAFSRDGKSLAVSDCVGQCDTRGGIASGISYVDLWNVTTSKIAATIKVPDTDHIFPVVMTISPDGKIIATGDDSANVYLWNTTTRKIATKITARGTDPRNGVQDLAFSPDGKTLAIGTGYGPTYLCSSITGKIIATLDGKISGTNEIAFSPDDKTLAVIDDTYGQIYIWDTTSRRITSTFTDTRGRGASGLAFSPDGKNLAVGDQNGRIYLWNTATRKLSPTLTDPSSGGIGRQGLAFSPDGKTLAVGDRNGRIYLWNTAIRKITAILTDPGRRSIGTVVFSRDGTTLAVADSPAEQANGRTYLWDLHWLNS